MKNAVLLFLAFLMLAACLSSCRITSGKRIRTLFFADYFISSEA